MTQTPISAYQETRGMVYFPRMLDKIRKHAAGELREDFHNFLGSGFDGMICDFLRVDYAAVRERTLEGGSDEDLLDWCFAQGRALNEQDIRIWNLFLTKLGTNDFVTEILRTRKEENGLGDRDDIQTMMEFFEVDEGRKA